MITLTAEDICCVYSSAENMEIRGRFLFLIEFVSVWVNSEHCGRSCTIFHTPPSLTKAERSSHSFAASTSPRFQFSNSGAPAQRNTKSTSQSRAVKNNRRYKLLSHLINLFGHSHSPFNQLKKWVQKESGSVPKLTIWHQFVFIKKFLFSALSICELRSPLLLLAWDRSVKMCQQARKTTVSDRLVWNNVWNNVDSKLRTFPNWFLLCNILKRENNVCVPFASDQEVRFPDAFRRRERATRRR